MSAAEHAYSDLTRAWKSLRASGVGLREVACVGAPRTLLVADLPALRAPAAGARLIALAAGVHGDEPAGPWALLSLLRDGLLDRRLAYRIWICTNPSGYAAGTRENAEGTDVNRSFGRGGTSAEARAIITANRDRHFALSLDLHEDLEADGFYCYEPRRDTTRAFGGGIVRAVAAAGFPIQTFADDFDLAFPAAFDPAALQLEPGCVTTDARAEAAAFGSALPYTLYLLRRAATFALTFESPARLAWDERIAIHRIAAVEALTSLDGDGAFDVGNDVGTLR